MINQYKLNIVDQKLKSVGFSYIQNEYKKTRERNMIPTNLDERFFISLKYNSD